MAFRVLLGAEALRALLYREKTWNRDIVIDCVLFTKWKEKQVSMIKPSAIFDDRRAPYIIEFITFHGEGLRNF